MTGPDPAASTDAATAAADLAGAEFRWGVLLLVVNLSATWFMAGLIWLIQLVHYPQFALIGVDGWAEYHRRHVSTITLIVGPAMLIELLSAVGLLWLRPVGVPAWVLWAGLVMIVLLWASTATLQVPAHDRLSAGMDEAQLAKLVGTNWLRTALWTGRGVLMAWCLWQAVGFLIGRQVR